MRRTLALPLLMLASACSGGPTASPQADQQAKQFEAPQPNRGAVYVFRSGLMGFARSVDVQVAGGSSATLPINSYVRLEGPPGPIEIDCKVGDHQGAAQIDVVDGRTRFVEVSMTSGIWAPGCQVAEVAPEVGRSAVMKGRMVERQ